MNPFSVPQQYYAKEGLFSLMGIGYTAALATMGFSLVNMREDRVPEMAIALVGGGLATWGFLVASRGTW